MYKYILEGAGNINWMAILALSTFFFLFVTSAILVFRRDKNFLDHMSNLPLEDSYSETNEK